MHISDEGFPTNLIDDGLAALGAPVHRLPCPGRDTKIGLWHCRNRVVIGANQMVWCESITRRFGGSQENATQSMTQRHDDATRT
jgi:hypothetical protein